MLFFEGTKLLNPEDPAFIEALKRVCAKHGLSEISGTPHLVAALSCGLRTIESTDPWGEPFVLVPTADWRGIDGTRIGDVQLRVTDTGKVQLREYSPVIPCCKAREHIIGMCSNCWQLSALESASTWRSVGARVQVRLRETKHTASGEPQVEIRRRIKQGEPMAEIDWSLPWVLPEQSMSECYANERDRQYVGTIWTNVSADGDVQVSTEHTFPRGILVRQATGREDVPWTTPRFLPRTDWQWSDLLSDGSMQFRCWWPEEENRRGLPRVEIRQQIGREPVFAVEPWWGERSPASHQQQRVDGYDIGLLCETSARGLVLSILGVRVTDPLNVTREYPVIGRPFLVAPNLWVSVSSLGFTWRVGALEPLAPTTKWTVPRERVLRTREWTMLGGNVRAKIARGRRERVRIQVRRDRRGRWWRSSWMPDGFVSFGTTHEYDSLRVTFRPDHVAVIQLAYTASKI